MWQELRRSALKSLGKKMKKKRSGYAFKVNSEVYKTECADPVCTTSFLEFKNLCTDSIYIYATVIL